MFHHVPRRPRGRYDRLVDPRYDPARATLEMRRLEAWALTMGVRLQAGGHLSHPRPRRGALPDVDYTQIVHRRLPWWRRLLAGGLVM